MLILVVDDEPAIALVLQELLEDEGYTVRTAANGQAALAQIAAGRPALVLCDVMMPRMTGPELYRQMQADPGLQEVPVVLMSAALDPPSPTPPSGFLRKPFDFGQLLALIEALIGPAGSA